MSLARLTNSPDYFGVYIEEQIFPCTRAELLRCAEDNDAPDGILDAIESLPEGFFRSPVEVVTQIAPYI